MPIHTLPDELPTDSSDEGKDEPLSTTLRTEGRNSWGAVWFEAIGQPPSAGDDSLRRVTLGVSIRIDPGFGAAREEAFFRQIRQGSAVLDNSLERLGLYRSGDVYECQGVDERDGSCWLDLEIKPSQLAGETLRLDSVPNGPNVVITRGMDFCRVEGARAHFWIGLWPTDAERGQSLWWQDYQWTFRGVSAIGRDPLEGLPVKHTWWKSGRANGMFRMMVRPGREESSGSFALVDPDGRELANTKNLILKATP